MTMRTGSDSIALGRDAPVRRDLVLSAAIILLLGLTLGQLGFFDAQRLSRGMQNLVLFSGDNIPPDLGIVPLGIRALLETIQMAFAGTLLGFIMALPLGVLGTATLFPLAIVLRTRLAAQWCARCLPSFGASSSSSS